VFDRSRTLVFRGPEIVARGKSSYFSAGEDIFLVDAPAPEEPPPLFVCFASTNKLPIRWEYDSATLAPVRAIASDNSASRLEFLAWMMAEMNNRSSLQALDSLLAHPAHFVRWAALQAIFRLDRDKGMVSLSAALEDPHEHIRDAARRSLAKMT
jgi:HEAT repeat protein